MTPHDFVAYETTINASKDSPAQSKTKVANGYAARRAAYKASQDATVADFEAIDDVPVISALTPSTKTAGSVQFTLTVDGSDFDSGTKVRWGGVTLATTFVSTTQVTAVVPAAQVATIGSYLVTAVTSFGIPSNGIAFTVT